ncbi:MAG: hypothetical protein V5A34_02125 [Halapricum sp.]
MVDKKTTGGRSRRSVLKSTGITLATIGGASGLINKAAASGGDSFRAKIRAGNRILKHIGPEARSEFFRNSGLRTGFKRANLSLARFQDGVGTQRVGCVEPEDCDGDIDLTLSITYDLYDGEYYVDLLIRHYIEYSNTRYTPVEHKGGEEPLDGCGLQWERDHWKLTDRTDIPASTSTDEYTTWDNGSWDYEGVAFQVDDRQMCDEQHEYLDFASTWTNYAHAGAYLRYGSDHEDGDSVTASYMHTWNEGSLGAGFGVSYPFGISLSATASSSVETENLQTTLEEQTLMVNANDAT